MALTTASRIATATLLTGVSDGLFSSVLSAAFYDSTVMRLWQGVASVLIGRIRAFEGGSSTALLGIAIHFAVAFTWTIVFALVALRIPRIQKLLNSPYGAVKIAVVYGPLIWIVMSLVVIPALTQRPPVITSRWWTQLAGHIPFVAL